MLQHRTLQNRAQQRLKSRGYTLIELMMVLAIAGILLAVGLPAMRNFTQNNRLITATNNMVSTLAYARSEAVKRSANVVVCPIAFPTDTAGLPTLACVTSGWDSNGTVVWVDTNGNSAISADEVLRIENDLPSAQGLSLNTGTEITFLPSGMIGVPEITLTVGDERSSGIACERAIVIERTGRAGVDKDASVCS